MNQEHGSSQSQPVLAPKSAIGSAEPSAAWRDLESAPRDGSRFWGRVDDDAIAMFWHAEFDGFISSYRQMVMAPGYLVDGKPHKDHSPVYHSPTAWMPLPSSKERPLGSERSDDQSPPGMTPKTGSEGN